MSRKIVSFSPLPAPVVQFMITDASGIKDIEVTVVNGLPESEIAEKVRGAEILLGDFTFNTQITPAVAEAARGAKLVQQPSVGYQHIDVEACAKAGIPVANTAGANTIGVAEHAVTLGLLLLKNLLYAHHSTSEGKWDQMGVDAQELGGKTWGLVGMGNIGKKIAERIAPFGVKILYYDKFRLSAEDEAKYGAEFSELDNLFKSSTVISLHCPLTDETKNMVNAERIAMMKKSTFLINVGRGELVDEIALAEALKKKALAGAAIDVFSVEPIPADCPFLGLKNVILTPHVGGATRESKDRIMKMAMGNVGAVLKGEKPINVVN